MKLRLALLGLFTVGCLTGLAQPAQKNSDSAYVPARASAERTAILDALRDYGVRDIKMPATPYNIWKAIADANADRETGKK